MIHALNFALAWMIINAGSPSSVVFRQYFCSIKLQKIPFTILLTGRQLNAIKQVSMARIVCDNTDIDQVYK